MATRTPAALFACSALTLALGAAFAHADEAKQQDAQENILVLGTAQEQVKQSLGVSVITAEDLIRRPPANDLSEIIRKMPGVNLTGNSASGQYGNNRQIDLRGMGPENTLILVDGKPVSSRNAVRMGRSGERNSRGDTNWVPVEAVERIEVLRGPAAARYGSGAAGGVINIVTKAPSEALTGSVSLFAAEPEDSREGNTRRLGFNLAGGLSQDLSFRLYGNINKTDADSLDLNGDFANSEGATPPAGREGVRNKDINGLLRWDLSPEQVLEFEAGYSRQGNIYAGDRAVSSNGSDLLTELANGGAETNTVYRSAASVAHRADWGFATSNLVLAYENTRNYRLNEGLAGGVEGSITNDGAKSTSTLDSLTLNGDINIPLDFAGLSQMLTLGMELGKDELDDPYSMSQGTGSGGAVPGAEEGTRDGKSDATYQALYVEDNIELTLDWILTPGVRFDHNSLFGNNWSPYLSTAYQLTDNLTLRGGIAKAFKAPNLYQANPNYLYYTRGNGCPVDFPSLGAGCYIQGNDDLDAETSVNKELGLEYVNGGWTASLAYFRNDYKNKIISGMVPTGTTDSDGRVFKWSNADKAVVAGVEGNLKVPLLGQMGEVLSWNTNFTYMDENNDKDTGEPLSVIPRYTVNSMLDWQVNEALMLSFTATRYGTQKPRNLTSTGASAEGDALKERDPYSVLSLGGSYRLNYALRFGFGVTNLTDRQLLRENNSGGAGANTYNEPGRAYYLSATYSF
ncbi:TonB-dependent siderophore receptor [Gallaecimonas xiamenensis]|uniref:TonB-dependent siderophore receptor n=1 Tax=Gallaecimonas xiamenensis 3-C-1 TaxID=745411 RepID=K2JXD3_9GAMM|nr:TonB-dependent siderophore receptor [Gallaecimonas xiamenensis]EKE69920.1 TonB-dependent siderophore receptor [Gallaecimonas xiamenensis 3-C-1]